MPNIPTNDAELIGRIAEDANRHIDRLQRRCLLWADVDNHIAASHIAEYTGDFALVALHLKTVTRLLAEIHREYPLIGRCRKKPRPIRMKQRRRYPVSRALVGPARSE